MLPVSRTAGVQFPAVFLLSIALGCISQGTTSSAQVAQGSSPDAVAQQLRTVASAGTLTGLKWPNFPDYSQLVQSLYQAVNYTPVWVHDGQPTSQAQVVIAALETSRQKGLNPEEYDASRWPARLDALRHAPSDP